MRRRGDRTVVRLVVNPPGAGRHGGDSGWGDSCRDRDHRETRLRAAGGGGDTEQSGALDECERWRVPVYRDDECRNDGDPRRYPCFVQEVEKVEGMDRPVRDERPEIVILVLLLSLCFSGCGKAGGDRAMVSSPSDPTVAKEGKPPSESGIPSPVSSRAGGVSLGLVPAGPDALTGVRAVVLNSPPGSKVSLEDLHWYVNGGETKGDIDRLAGTSLRRGDAITARAQVTVNDERISVDSPKAIVQNALPEIVSVSISPQAPKKGDTLRLVVSSRDADGDPVSHRCRWLLDDREIREETAETLSPGKGTKNSWVHAEVQVYDGIALGSKAFSQIGRAH